MYGKQNWFFPDAELPPPGDKEPYGHEAIIILNPNELDAKVEVRFYPDQTGTHHPVPATCTVKARTVICLRTDNPAQMNGFRPQIGVQYAISLHSDVPVVAQYGRLDVRQPNMAFLTAAGYAE